MQSSDAPESHNVSYAVNRCGYAASVNDLSSSASRQVYGSIVRLWHTQSGHAGIAVQYVMCCSCHPRVCCVLAASCCQLLLSRFVTIPAATAADGFSRHTPPFRVITFAAAATAVTVYFEYHRCSNPAACATALHLVPPGMISVRSGMISVTPSVPPGMTSVRLGMIWCRPRTEDHASLQV